MVASRSDSSTMSEMKRAPGLVEREVVPTERQYRAVHGRQRRAQLMRSGGDELSLELVEPVLFGDVMQRVDHCR